ncbi:hypothetical protein TSUD_88260 [Trifolium subterraneum]|uniref:Uncharacterized protein n=1 Tax=Trifolium subterraneum TaxID=3900 RepID=A0A2Z6NV66_TRISU|nr:hypothetical protein TSUD_88260 [Trifolium subterraneum]
MERITSNDGGSGMNLQAAVGEINRLKAKMTAMEQEKAAEKEKEREEEAELDNIQDSQPLAQALWDAQHPEGHNENLRQYLARFNEATIQVSNPNQEMFVAAVQNGLKVGHFNESLAQKPASTMQEVMKRAECYIKGEESNAEKRSRDSREKPSSRRSPERYNKGSSQRSGRYEDKGGGRYRQPWRSNERTYRAREEYTELNDSKVHVLDEILSSGLARLPPAPDSNARMGANENAWCHYHRAKGHDTEKCYRLKDLIEKLISSVKTDHPIKHVLKKPDLAGRMVAWAVELSEYDITFVPRGNIKSQLLADFILELSSPPEAMNMQPWTLSVDGASNIRGSGAGVVLEGPDGVLIEQSLRFAFKASNNQAEYEALIAGMRLAKEMEVADLRAKSDSQLVTSQVSGEFQAKDPQLIKYLEQVRSLAKHFNTFELIYVPREQNARADLLSKLASTKKPGNNRTVIQETVAKPSTGDLEVRMVTRNDDWRTPIIQYLENEKLPEEKEEKVKIKKMAAHYTMVGGELYKRGFSSPMLLCVGETESRRILNEIHNGSCGSHIGGRSLAGKVTRAGFFWPTLLSDANRHVRSCDQCQRHADLHHAPGEPLQSVMSPWPFYMWGVDILGPFTTSQGQAKFLLVAVDYFTKWIEAEPVATISSERVKKFYWKNILCRFSIPKYIVSDNGTQFTSESVINFCQEKGIRNTFISVEHPQANGQAESANKVILRAIKRRLEGKDKNWVEHLLPTLWSYHTTIHSSTRETPFKMVYGADAMIPAEVDPPSWRRATLTAEVNSEALKENLDLIDEVREIAHFREFTVKQRASRKYNTRVMAREFREGDLVLKRPMGRNKGGKLAPNWEGP